MESKALDAALAAKNTATDGAYIMAQDASGNTIRIAKADLASVLAAKMGVDLGRTITIGAGESAMISLNGAYYLDVDGQGIMNGILLVRTRYSLNILAKTNDTSYDKLTIEQDGVTNVKLTNTADVEQTVIYRKL